FTKRVLSVENLKEKIALNMLKREAFSSYIEDEKGVIIYAYYPVYNLNEDAIAWFVSYTNSQTIESILFTSKVIQIFAFFISLIIYYFAMKQIKSEEKITELSLNLMRQVELFTDNVMAWESNLDGDLSFITHSLLQTGGFKEEELLGQPYRVLHTGGTDSKEYKKISQTLITGNVWTADYKYRFKGGGFYWVRCSIYPKFNEGNDVVGYQTILHSIDAEKSKEQFLANMSHEIRTPLNAIMGFIKVLKEEHKDLKYLDIINNSSKSLLQIINDILDFSKIESGKLDVEYHSFDPVYEFGATKDLFTSKCAEKSIQLHVNFHNVPSSLYGDSLRIKQVVNNLLSNAIKFTPMNKNIFLDIKYKNKILHISVTDEGIGISKEYQKTIFESFTQADVSTTRKYGGTGLGLTISTSLVQLMGGTLEVKSKLNHGSTFYFSLPLEIGSRAQIQSEKDEVLELPHLKVLLVEDNKSNQLFMKVILKKLHMKFDIANDGIEGVEQFKNNKYDLILMDENMTNMNGIKATQEILLYEKKKNLIHTPIIALTANAFRGDREKFLNAGMDAYLTKPLDKKLFISTILKVLKKQ
ncbi:MAG: ATP-binding protein, partial [Sulfurimonas sp.]|nr:ATP-binding protein [Sulfurimonas sp.]